MSIREDIARMRRSSGNHLREYDNRTIFATLKSAVHPVESITCGVFHRTLATGEIDHLSVFALAPQPLLILLGTLLGDIVPAQVYQRHREPPTWQWPATTKTPAFEVHEPAMRSGPPALLLALSATVTSDRIRTVLGRDVAIWTVTVPTPHNDIMKSREQLSRFRALLRPVFDRIKAAHGQTTLLHLFPVAPLSAAVECGRVRMPKADMPWCIYDQVSARGGFVTALSIP